MQRIVALAAADEQRAGAALGQAQTELQAARKRLDELRNYRSDYEGREAPEGAVSAVRWQDYRAFLSRLDQALQAQQQLVADADSKAASERRRWMSKRQRRESLQRVSERYRRDASLAAERQQQKRIDDLPKTRNHFHGE